MQKQSQRQVVFTLPENGETLEVAQKMKSLIQDYAKETGGIFEHSTKRDKEKMARVPYTAEDIFPYIPEESNLEDDKTRKIISMQWKNYVAPAMPDSLQGEVDEICILLEDLLSKNN